jgi:DNA-binding response OmpR family regulator
MKRVALVVEDELDTGHLLAENLKRWGFEPTVFTEGKPALAWARQQHPDLILLDLMLPDLDGFSVCESLKLDRETNLIPVIMVTGLSSPEDRTHGFQVGANRYLTKPFTAEELRRLIDETLRWREDLKQLLSSLFLFSGLGETQARHLTTAVREVGTNAIEWGHRKQTERIVTVVYRIDAEKVTIDIRDTGEGFDPKNMPHAAKPDDPISHTMVREALGMRDGGFGIMMARGLVDKLEYNEAGNEVRLIKYFDPAKRPAPAAEKN